MSLLLFNLRGVPEDESDDVRQLLTQADIRFYETPAGRWGISLEAIWLSDESQREQAESLLDAYQQQRSASQRVAYQQRKEAGEEETLLSRWMHQPLRVLVYLALAVAVGYLSIYPFLHLG